MAVILKSLATISKYVGCSPTTILRWHDDWQKYGDVSLAFPMYQVGTGKGQGITWVSNTDLIMLWMRKMSEYNAKQRVGRKKKAPRGLSVRMAARNSGESGRSGETRRNYFTHPHERANTRE